MGEKTVTTWVCDRCGAVEEVEGTGQPHDWSAWGFCAPPRAWGQNGGELKKVGILCNPCGGLGVDFMHGNEYERMKQDIYIALVTELLEKHESLDSGDAIAELVQIRDDLVVAREADEARRREAEKEPF